MGYAYDLSYLNDAACSLGELFDYMVNYIGIDSDRAFNMFAHSLVGKGFEEGNPKYIAGHTGIELSFLLIYEIKGIWVENKYDWPLEKSKEYWAGWALAQYQCEKAMRFRDMIDYGLTASKVIDMYILHEADINIFMEKCDAIIESGKKHKDRTLKRLREYHKLTQKSLSEKSGVSLRMIQLYEQGQNDITKAQANVVLKLAKALDCSVEDLIS